VVRKNISSRIIHSVGYDSEQRVLEVELLRRKKDAKRVVYRYLAVPHSRYLEMMGMGQPEGHSVGSYFLTYIKPNYTFEKVEEQSEDESKESGDDFTPPEAA
jgi:hypothetical protein